LNATFLFVAMAYWQSRVIGSQYRLSRSMISQSHQVVSWFIAAFSSFCHQTFSWLCPSTWGSSNPPASAVLNLLDDSAGDVELLFFLILFNAIINSES